MKKLSRILCKLLGCSCAINFTLEISNVKIIAMDGGKTNVHKPNKSDNKSTFQSAPKLALSQPLGIQIISEEKPMFPGTNKPMFPNEPSGLNFNQRLRYRWGILLGWKIAKFLDKKNAELKFYEVHKDYITPKEKETFVKKVDDIIATLFDPNSNASLKEKLKDELKCIEKENLNKIFNRRRVESMYDHCAGNILLLKHYYYLLDQDDSEEEKIEKYIDDALCLIWGGKENEAKMLMDKCSNKMKKMLKKYLFDSPIGEIWSPAMNFLRNLDGIDEHDNKLLNQYIDEIIEAKYSNNIEKLEMLNKGLYYKCRELANKYQILKFSNKTHH